MTRYAILTLLSLLLLSGCRTRREAQPSVDVHAHVEADTGGIQREQTDTSHAEATAEGGITITEETEVTYDSTGQRPVRIVRRIDIRWMADLQSLIAHTSRSSIDSTASHASSDIEAKQPAVEPERTEEKRMDAVKWVAIALCIYGFVIIVKQLLGIWKN